MLETLFCCVQGIVNTDKRFIAVGLCGHAQRCADDCLLVSDSNFHRAQCSLLMFAGAEPLHQPHSDSKYLSWCRCLGQELLAPARHQIPGPYKIVYTVLLNQQYA